MAEPVIRVENLSKQYTIGASNSKRYETLRDRIVEGLAYVVGRNGRGGCEANTIWALKNVSFEAHHGEVLAVIGRNGAGKSTLLKILSRITEPTTGSAMIQGRVGSLLEVGTGFHGELTGRENIYLNGAILGMKNTEIRAKFDEIVAFAEVEKFIDTPVKHYSSGMYMRLAFAVAAHLEPEILLVDEVLAVGDASFQRKCLGKMETVAHREGRTVLFVSHNMAAVENLCERAVLLKDGAITSIGATREVLDAYLSEIRGLAATPLVERRDREGEGEILAARIELLDGAEKPAQYQISGQPLIIRFHYTSNNKDTLFRNCRVSVSVNKSGRCYFLLSTDLVDTRLLDLQGEGFIDFIVPELPLSGGTYSLGAYIESNKVIQDWIDDAAEMTVVDGDFYGTGRLYPPSWQGKSVLVKHSWKLHTN
ncbi:MAG TPA: ABC transporter ATP-binding protein [Candidatus Eisenbacteria bacterium]|nr:ABC transporter ATP-binding protein [Candidatus Eisenbacteria bacterium]